MAGDTLAAMPMSPLQGPSEVGSAAVRFAKSRRGRVLIAGVLCLFFILELAGARRSPTLSSSYQSISSYHLPSWRPHLPHLPSIIASPLKPSNTTLKLENGDMEHVPARLHKTTPNFHLLMSAAEDTPDFCRTTLSAAMLNLPPPTMIGFYEKYDSVAAVEKGRLDSTLAHLRNEKLVNEDDLLLIVDGQDTWFQLPSEVIIRQYQNLLEDANKRLKSVYGSKFAQTIIFGALKTCEGEDVACRHVRQSTLPSDIYGTAAGEDADHVPAKFLDAKMLIGPAKDLTTLYEAAVRIFEEKKSESATVQSIMATLFGEQQMARNMHRKTKRPVNVKVVDWFSGSTAEPLVDEEQSANVTLAVDRRYEFSMGLDYTHTLFQPLGHTAHDELIPLLHDDSTDLSAFHREGTPTPPLVIPAALARAKPPYWVPDLSTNNPSPNKKSSHIAKLEHSDDLDDLKPRDTPWSGVPLVQNTYTAAIPAMLHVDNRIEPRPVLMADARASAKHAAAAASSSSNITWSSLWYASSERALLRKHLRTRQSAISYHDRLVGGDRTWDERGGRGGVWTATTSLWLPFLEVDGVCGRVEQMAALFGDGRGVWLHEGEPHAESDRVKEELEFSTRVELARLRDAKAEQERRKKEEELQEEQRKEKEKERKDKAEERLQREGEERERKDKDRAESEEREQRIEVEEKIGEVRAGAVVKARGSDASAAEKRRRWRRWRRRGVVPPER